MKRTTQRIAAVAVTLVLALSTVAMAAPKSQGSKHITVEGRVLEVNREARTLLVSDQWSKKLYLVYIPKGETFKITFGMNMRTAEPQFEDAIRIRLAAENDLPPVDVIKVDRSFTAGLGSNESDSAVVAAVLSLARSLDLIGVEAPDSM